MGQRLRKQKTQAEKDLAATKKELLDTQEMLANLVESITPSTTTGGNS